VSDEDLVELQRTRFAGLPLDCGQDDDPGVLDAEEWRDWSAQPTTTDQWRIEAYLDRFSLRGKRILHVGVGNSGLARRLHRDVAEIVGTTVVPAECRHGESLDLPNYRVLLHNKYLAAGAPAGPFDFIVDNNPTTFGCCLKHLRAMLESYAAALAPGGRMVTDRQGLGWVSAGPGQNPRWAFDFDDLAAVAPLAGLGAWRHDETIFLLAKRPPAAPGALSGLVRLGHRIRRKARRMLGAR